MDDESIPRVYSGKLLLVLLLLLLLCDCADSCLGSPGVSGGLLGSGLVLGRGFMWVGDKEGRGKRRGGGIVVMI
jgi:hypothetical protein